MKGILLFLITHLFYLCSLGQIDSLEKELKGAKDIDNRVGLLCDLSYAYIYNDTVKSKMYLAEAIEAGKRTKDNYSLGLINYSIGNLIFTTQTSSDKPKQYFIIAQKYFAKVSGYKGMYGKAMVYKAMGDIFMFEGEYDGAIKNFLNSIKLVEELQTKEGNTQLAAAYSGIGSVYLYMAQYDKGVDYKLKAIAIFESLKNNDHELAMNYMQTAYGYCFDGKMPETKQYLERGKIILDTLKKDNEAYMQYYEISGQYYDKTTQPKKAIETKTRSKLRSKNREPVLYLHREICAREKLFF